MPESNIEELQRVVGQFKKLIDKPEFGCSTWHWWFHHAGRELRGVLEEYDFGEGYEPKAKETHGQAT